MKKSKIFIIGITLIGIVSIIALIFFSSNVMKRANVNNEKEIVASTNDKKIVGTFKTNTSWVEDPLIPENVIKMSYDYSIIKAKVTSIGETNFLKLTDPSPYTPIEIEIKEIIEGTAKNDLKTIYIEGGDVKVSEVLKTLNEAEKEKMELNNITEEDAKNMYISYISDEDYNLELDKEYIFILSNKDNSIIMAGGYGIFTEENTLETQTQSQNATRIFTNVLSGNKLNISNSHESI